MSVFCNYGNHMTTNKPIRAVCFFAWELKWNVSESPRKNIRIQRDKVGCVVVIEWCIIYAYQCKFLPPWWKKIAKQDKRFVKKSLQVQYSSCKIMSSRYWYKSEAYSSDYPFISQEKYKSTFIILVFAFQYRIRAYVYMYTHVYVCVAVCVCLHVNY